MFAVAAVVACKAPSPPSNVNAGLPPALGAHALAFQRYRSPSALSVVSTPAMVTATGGRSTIVVSVGRGAISAFARPRDNKNPLPYPQLGATHAYAQWPSSGTALYALTGAIGGSGHVLSTKTKADDELTIAAVEVVNGGTVGDFKWNQVAGGNPITSLGVTTTGPATLVAFWWGDAGVEGEKTATANNGFVVIDSILESGALVQCAVATKTVSAAGTYDVTWTSTPVQGAQLWLVAVQ
ncbi:hypothetical protein AKJ09_05096 [Labilithrix luteola]|uniref:Uncharacterized protein n=1 Tax=Labilithrix luteola TaxID=1391654 RepID=A0A0K1PY45_9BACT|nr:hypothetical protein AKJ09_05096 [Labilithrix luteola]